ncbi:hypothetical protein TDB9533_02443 [Thalassocella blandensis]|nr:hypothetical protein TDB9533_02443 [Thalassocella blandensis]
MSTRALALALLITIPFFIACSEQNQSPTSVAALVTPPPPSEYYKDKNEAAQNSSIDDDCPNFTDLFARLPQVLVGEVTDEQYFSCDPVSPRADSHFSREETTFWTLSITSLDSESPPAKHRWNLPDIDDAQRNRLKQGIQAAINAEVLLHDICKNNANLNGLPEWHKTHIVSSNHFDICIGTDAQKVEDSGWTARAKTREYLYTLKFEGDKATQFATAQAAANYVTLLYQQFP